jgi:hypothetical protein
MQVLNGFCPTFPLPKTGVFSFRQALSSHDTTILEFVERANAMRESLAAALNLGDADRSMEAIDAYLPMLSGLKNMLAQDDGMLVSRGGMAFTWTSGCDKKSGKRDYTMHGLQFEMVMIAAALAYARCNKATALFETIANEDDFEPIAKQAAALYRSAAGLCDHIAETVLPLPTLPYSRPPEVLPDFHRALSFIFRCCAQQVHRLSVPAQTRASSPACVCRFASARPTDASFPSS